MIFDQYQRYKNAEQIIHSIRKNGESFKILEVGANEHRNLEKFLPNDTILYLDITLPEDKLKDPSYVLGDATDMDFECDSFDVVVALDVYEHIQPERRQAFLSEIARVSSRLFIIGAPFATEEVKEAEKRLNNVYLGYTGKDHPFLIEHIENGLPELEETLEHLKQSEYKITTFSHGNLALWERLIRVDLASGINQELCHCAEDIYEFYNKYVFSGDHSEKDYRHFLVGAKEDIQVQFKAPDEEALKHLSVLEKQYWALCREVKHSQQLEALYKEALEKANRAEEDLETLRGEFSGTVEELNREIQNVMYYYTEILNSESWKLTKPLRFVLRKLKEICRSNKVLYACAQRIKTFFKEDIVAARNKIRRKLQERKKFPKDILFSILVPVYNTPQNFLEEMIESVRSQIYSKWELCLVDASDPEHGYVEAVCRRYAQRDKRIKYKKLLKNEGISENTNAAIEMATGHYIGLLDHDDLLHPSALFEYMKVICKKDADVIYSDEDIFDVIDGRYYNPNHKPDFSIDYLRSNNYICHFMAFKKELLDKVGLFRKQCDGSQDHDMILRLVEVTDNIAHVPQILYHWRASATSVALNPDIKPYTATAGILAINEHLERSGLKGTAESSWVHPNVYRIRYEIEGSPLVSIMIPNKDHVADLSRCIDSILTKSTYQNYEIIIIENNSVEKQTFDYYQTLESNPAIRVVTYKPTGEFNYSAINNYGIQFAKGEHLLLLNNDVEIITENWIEEMLMFLQRQDVGVVGAKLYYPNETLQHAGVIIGIGGVADHAHRHFPRDAAGYMMRCWIQQDMSAVTGACLMIKKSVFEEVGGLDEESFKVAFNDIDLCLKVRAKGYLVVWTPYAEAYHHESKSRGAEDTPAKRRRFEGEILAFRKKWKKVLTEGDPYYNPNLSLERTDYHLRID